MVHPLRAPLTQHLLQLGDDDRLEQRARERDNHARAFRAVQLAEVERLLRERVRLAAAPAALVIHFTCSHLPHHAELIGVEACLPNSFREGEGD